MARHQEGIEIPLRVIFLIVAVILFALASFNVPAERLNLTAGGLAFFAASFLV